MIEPRQSNKDNEQNSTKPTRPEIALPSVIDYILNQKKKPKNDRFT